MKRDLIFLFSDTKNKVWNEKRLYLNILKKVFNIHIFYFSENSLKNYNFFEKKNFFNFKKKFNNPIFMNYLSIKKKNYEIFNTLKINNCKQVFVYSLRPKFKSLSLMSYLNKYYLNFLLKLFFKKIKSFFLYEKKYTFNYDHYITNDMSIPKKKLIKMHENNYYKFLDYKKKFQLLKNLNQTVFIDDAPHNHPDFKKLNSLPQLIDIKNYKKKLQELLSQFEYYFGTKIVIAGHPRLKNSSIYKKNFGRFKVLFDQTENLVASSRYVIAHDSTSINYAILHKKPILSLNSKLFYHHYQNKIKKMSTLIGSNHFYLENKYFKKNLFPKLNLKKYDKYINTFLKCRALSSEKPWSDFIVKFSKKL